MIKRRCIDCRVGGASRKWPLPSKKPSSREEIDPVGWWKVRGALETDGSAVGGHFPTEHQRQSELRMQRECK